jgi:perosamine synthetase
MKRIPIIKPQIDRVKLFSNLNEVLDSGILTKGKFVRQFEQQMADFLGVKYCFAVTSATTALHLSLVANHIQAGDEVLVSDFTFPATANVIMQVNATPVFIDIDLTTFCMDVEDLKKKITPKSKAIMVVHAFGYPANMTEIAKIAKENNLLLIEDAACALGSYHKDKPCGAWSDVSCFSFHPRKVITTGEGGIIATDSDEMAEEIEILRNHGSQKNEQGSLEFIKAGFNYRMCELQAALGVEQMDNFQEIENKRRELAEIYLEELANVPGLTLIQEPEDGVTNFQSFVVLLGESIDRESVMKELLTKGIETTIGTYALHTQKAYAHYGYKPADLTNSYIAFTKSLSLPLFYSLTKEDQNFIIKSLKEILQTNEKN